MPDSSSSILMTTSAIIAGLAPTALGLGIGGAQHSAIAVTIIGGQSLCLLLTLLLVPWRTRDSTGSRSVTWRTSGSRRGCPGCACGRDVRDRWPDVGGTRINPEARINHRGAERALKDCDGQHKCEGAEAVEACAEISG